MKQQTLLAALLLVAGLAAVAQDSKILRTSNGEFVEEITGTLTPSRTVKVKTTSGPIRLTGGNQQKTITYTVTKHVRASSVDAARREFARLRFTVLTSGDVALIRGECEGESRG